MYVLFIDTLRNNPEKFTQSCDIVEFCGVIANSNKGKHDGLSDPFNTDIQIAWFTADDIRPFVQKIDTLMGMLGSKITKSKL
jgi:hypothetical protein